MTLPCCGGYGEHFSHCDTGREIRRLRTALMRRNAVRECEPARPAFDVWRAAVQRRLDEQDAGDRAWSAYSSSDGKGIER